MSDPEHRTVRVRRSPKVGVFLGLGAGVGALAALIGVLSSPPDPQIPTPQALGFVVLLLAPLGALAGGAVALVLDAISERRARTAQAQRMEPDRAPAVSSRSDGEA